VWGGKKGTVSKEDPLQGRKGEPKAGLPNLGMPALSRKAASRQRLPTLFARGPTETKSENDGEER